MEEVSKKGKIGKSEGAEEKKKEKEKKQSDGKKRKRGADDKEKGWRRAWTGRNSWSTG
jgi:hypothetical protein